MILTCPECGTQYAVKDGAIPEGGRKVRCASCGHSWHQNPEDVEAGADLEPAPVAEPSPAPGDPAAPASSPQGVPGAAQEIGYDVTEPVPPGGDLVDPPAAVPVPPPGGWPEARSDEQDWDPEKEIPDEEEIAAVRSETRSDRKRTWVMGVLFAIALVALIVLGLWLIAPDSLRERVGFAAAAPTPLQIAPGMPERQRLESGNELVVVSGRVINPSSETQQVPPIEARLHDSSGRLIYAWTIAPPARSLPPGGSATFNSAEVDVPPSGLDSTVTLSLKG